MSIFRSSKGSVIDDTKSLACTIESSYNLKDHTEYLLLIRCGPTADVIYHVTKRYSDFASLDSVLRGYGVELPLPPKKIFGKMDSEFVEQRQRGLQSYLDALLAHPWAPLCLDVRCFLCPEQYLHLDLHETALQNVSMFLRSEEQWQVTSLLPRIGWRLRKCYVAVSDRSHPKEKYLLTWCTCGPHRTLEDRELEQSMKVLTTLQHPGIEPTLFATCNTNCTVVIRKFQDSGTLRDILCSVKQPSMHFMKKYASPKALKLIRPCDIRLFGRQLLETLKFLQEKGFPFVHVHAGNILIDDLQCRILDLENSFLGLPSFHRSRYVQLHKLQTAEAVTVYCFGHLLYEMSTGQPLTATMCDVVPSYISQDLKSILELTLSSAAIKSGLPSISDLLQHPFFSGVTLSEFPANDAVQVKIPNKLKQAFQTSLNNFEQKLREEQQIIYNYRRLAKAQAFHMSDEERNRRRLQKMRSLNEASALSEASNVTNGRESTRESVRESVSSQPLSPQTAGIERTRTFEGDLSNHIVPPPPPLPPVPDVVPVKNADNVQQANGDAVGANGVENRSQLLTSITGFNKNCLRKTQSVDSSSQRQV